MQKIISTEYLAVIVSVLIVASFLHLWFTV